MAIISRSLGRALEGCLADLPLPPFVRCHVETYIRSTKNAYI